MHGNTSLFSFEKIALGEHNVIDLHAVFVGLEHAFGPHNDTSHKAAFNEPITLHGNVWFSKGYKSGDVDVKFEDFSRSDEMFCDANSAWEGRCGNAYSAFCKSE